MSRVTESTESLACAVFAGTGHLMPPTAPSPWRPPRARALFNTSSQSLTCTERTRKVCHVPLAPGVCCAREHGLARPPSASSVPTREHGLSRAFEPLAWVTHENTVCQVLRVPDVCRACEHGLSLATKTSESLAYPARESTVCHVHQALGVCRAREHGLSRPPSPLAFAVPASTICRVPRIPGVCYAREHVLTSSVSLTCTDRGTRFNTYHRVP